MKLMSLFLFSSAALALAQPVRFYVGTYTENHLSQGVYTGTLDEETGRLSPLELAAAMQSPNFLAVAPDQNHLYAVTPTNGGSVAAFQVESNGGLTLLNVLSAGKDCCHLSVDGTGRDVFAASYSGKSLASFRTKPDGSMGERTQLQFFTGSGPNLQRQTQPHLHSIYIDAENRHGYACDLGTDNIWFFGVDAHARGLQLLDPPSFKVPPGSGPRHLAFSPDEHFAYVNGEMGLNVNVFSRDTASGALKLIQTVPILPPQAETNGFTSAEIFCHPSGKWLYVSNRDVDLHGRDSIGVFAIGAAGRLTGLQNAPVPVEVPRGFGIDPMGRWIIVGGQSDNKLAVLKIDAVTGRLATTDQTAKVGSPVCVIFERSAK